MHRRFPAPVRAADEGGGGGSPVTPAPAAPEAPAAPAAPAAPGTLLTADPAAQPTATPPAEGQPQGDTKPDDKPADGKADQPALTVESYKELALPDGVPLANPEGLEAYKALFAEKNIPPEVAQDLVNLHAEQQRKAIEAQAKVNAEIAAWPKQAEADPEFGGADFAKNMGFARQAISAFGGKAFADFLDGSGLGNHPELIRAFYRVGKAMAEDGRVTAGGAPKGDRLSALYPTMASKE